MHTLQQIGIFPSFETQPVGIPKSVRFFHSTNIIRFLSINNIYTSAPKPESKSLRETISWRVRSPWRVCVCVFLGHGRTSRAQKVATTNNSRNINVNMPPLDPAHPLGKSGLINLLAVGNL